MNEKFQFNFQFHFKFYRKRLEIKLKMKLLPTIIFVMFAAVATTRQLSEISAEFSFEFVDKFDVVESVDLFQAANPGLGVAELDLVQTHLHDQRTYTIGKRKKGEK